MFKALKLIGFFAFLSLASSVFAGGVILYEIGSTDLQFASAGWAARAEDASTAFTNPAGMTRLDCCEFLFGVQPIYSNIRFDPNDKTTVKGSHGNASAWLPAGGAYLVCPVTEDLRAGFALVGYCGSTLNYFHNWVGRYYVEKTTLMSFSAVPSLAYRITDCLSVGAGLNVMYGFTRTQAGINNVLDQLPDGVLRVHDYKFGTGADVGILYELSPCTRIGVQYLSRVKLNFKMTPSFHDVGPTLNLALQLLGVLDSKIIMKIKVPQCVMVSFYHEVDPTCAIMANFGWQQWSKFGRVSINLNSPLISSLSTVIPFKDTYHYAVGMQYRYNCNTKFSGGVAYDTSCVTNKNRTLDFPIGAQWRFATGLEYTCRENLDLFFAYELLWSGDLRVNVHRGPLAGTVDGKFRNLSCHFLEMGLIWQF